MTKLIVAFTLLFSTVAFAKAGQMSQSSSADKGAITKEDAQGAECAYKQGKCTAFDFSAACVAKKLSGRSSKAGASRE